MTADPILAVHEWPTNAEMMADVAQLYIRPDDEVLDLTYGLGIWWRKFRPDRLWLLCADGGFTLSPEGAIDVEPDFRNLPEEWRAKFPVTTFDPPYISMGGRATSTINDFNNRYGLVEASRTPLGLHHYNLLGLEQAAKVTSPGGYIMVKCMPYISSAKMQPVPMWTHEYATTEMGLKLEDWFVHKGEPGPQPLTDKCRPCNGTGRVEEGTVNPEVMIPEFEIDCPNCAGFGKVERRQVHARQNASHLFVFRKPGRRRKKGASS